MSLLYDVLYQLILINFVLTVSYYMHRCIHHWDP